MTTETFTMGSRIKLSGMMFLQYMLVPVWFLPLATYLRALEMSEGQIAWIMSSMALGCLTSPLVGMVADRHFSSERVLAVLNLAVAILLIIATQVSSPLLVFILLLAVMLCYMPTWGLTSAIAMGHSPSEQFPQIRVFGSIGWVASGIFSLVASYSFDATIDGTVTTLYCGAATALVAAVFAVTLPHTPPPAKGQPASVLDALGLRSMILMKDLQFAIFMIFYFLIMIPFAIYWSYFSLFLQDKGFAFITITMNWGQVAEMIFMLAVPLAIARVGLKWAMTIGVAMLLVRYASLLLGEMLGLQALYFLAILVHGLIFGFFFVGGQIYVDRKAPKELKAQAQGFLFLAGFGVGLLVGNLVNAALIEHYGSRSVPVVAALPADAVFPESIMPPAGVSVTDVRVYSRILNEFERNVLTAANEDQIVAAREAAEEKGVVIDLEKGLVLQGDLDAIEGEAVPSPITFSMKAAFPEKPSEKLDGELLSVGQLQLAVRENSLVYKAGDGEILARRIAIPFAPKGETLGDPITVAGTYDGNEIQFHAGGSGYTVYDWQPIWMITTACCVVLLLGFMALFHDAPKAEGEDEASEGESEFPAESDTGASPAE